MDNQTTALTTPKPGPQYEFGPVSGGLIPQTFEALWNLATLMANSRMMPAGIQTPEDVFVAVQMGLEVGLSPIQAVQNIAVINGRPSIWGDAVLALVRASGKLLSFDESFVGTFGDDNYKAVCKAARDGQDHPIVREFSIADAKLAGLWGGAGSSKEKREQSPWFKYPKRMLQMRARSWALRDGFGDVLKGLHMAEEVMDYDIEMTASSNGTYKPVAVEQSSLEKKILTDTDPPVVTKQAPQTETIQAGNAPPPKRRGRPRKKSDPHSTQQAKEGRRQHSNGKSHATALAHNAPPEGYNMDLSPKDTDIKQALAIRATDRPLWDDACNALGIADGTEYPSPQQARELNRVMNEIISAESM